MHIVGGIAWIILIAWITFYSILFFAKSINPRRSSWKTLFIGFNQKMWMTVGLGSFFFGFYIFLVWALSWAWDLDKKKQFFLRVYNNPVKFIYLGLFSFVCLSIGIYLTRILIKYLYNSFK